jgi:branched-chain amino acid transport system permease protein
MYWVSIITEAGIFAILALGLDVVWGWGGDFDLAFYAYLALGSYMTFVLSIGKPTPPVEYIIGWHLPVLIAILLAVVIVVCFAAVVGAIALRNLRGIYFAVTTLAASAALYLLVENYTPLFDGYNGVYGLTNPGQSALNLTYNGYRIFFLVIVLVLLFLCYLLVQRLSRSPFGRMVRSVREDERAAAAYGRQIFFTKYRAYLFGAGRSDRRPVRHLHQRVQPVSLDTTGTPADLRGDSRRRPRQPPRRHPRRICRLHRLH